MGKFIRESSFFDVRRKLQKTNVKIEIPLISIREVNRNFHFTIFTIRYLKEKSMKNPLAFPSIKNFKQKFMLKIFPDFNQQVLYYFMANANIFRYLSMNLDTLKICHYSMKIDITEKFVFLVALSCIF